MPGHRMWCGARALALALCGVAGSHAGSTHPSVSDRLDVAFPFSTRVGLRTPHTVVRCEASVKPREKQVRLSFRYLADGHLRSTRMVEACAFRPTATAQRSASQLLVAGKVGSGALVLEEWSLSHPERAPTPGLDERTGLPHYPEYRATVAARRRCWTFETASAGEAVEWLQFVRGGAGALVLVKLHEADDLLRVDLETGASTVLFEGGDASAPNFVSALAAPWNSLSVYRHAQHGDIYVLQRFDRPSLDPRVALVFEDRDRDGALDGWHEFVDYSEFDTYLGAEQGAILESYTG